MATPALNFPLESLIAKFVELFANLYARKYGRDIKFKRMIVPRQRNLHFYVKFFAKYVTVLPIMDQKIEHI